MHSFTIGDHKRMREAGILIKEDGNFLWEGRVVCDEDHYDYNAPPQGVANEYRRNTDPQDFGTRIWTIAEMFALGKIDAFHYQKHAILWDGIIYDPLRPSPMADYIMDTVADQLRDKLGRGVWRARNYCPLGLREGFMAVPDLVVLPVWERRTEPWPPPAHEPPW